MMITIMAISIITIMIINMITIMIAIMIISTITIMIIVVIITMIITVATTMALIMILIMVIIMVADLGPLPGAIALQNRPLAGAETRPPGPGQTVVDESWPTVHKIGQKATLDSRRRNGAHPGRYRPSEPAVGGRGTDASG